MAITWLKAGVESSKQVQVAEQEIQQAKEMKGRMFRYSLKEGEKADFTFVDGDLIDVPGANNKVLNIRTFWEHTVIVGKKPHNYICTQGVEDGQCPLCANGNFRMLSGVLTVIDHRQFESKATPGKVYSNTKKLFVVRKDGIKLMQMFAEMYGGLAGARFTALRSGQKSPSVGSNFIFINKTSIEELKTKYVENVEVDGKIVQKSYFFPANYEEEIVYTPRAQLIANGVTMGGGMPGLAGGSVSDVDYKKDL